MKAEDVSKMVSAALITFVIALAAFWPVFINATDEGNSVSPKIADPRVAAGGVEMKLKAAGNRTFKEGEEPIFELTAVNTTDQPTSVTVGTLMTATPAVDRRSRTLAMAVPLWQDLRTITLGPRQTQIITESTNATLQPNKKIDVYLGLANAAPNSRAGLVSMLSFSTEVVPLPGR